MRIGSSCCDNQRSFSSLHPSACCQVLPDEALVVHAALRILLGAAAVASIAIIVIVFSIAAIGSLVTWAWVNAALRTGLAPARECEPSNVSMGMLLAATAMFLSIGSCPLDG
jgi:hypothetical protein